MVNKLQILIKPPAWCNNSPMLPSSGAYAFHHILFTSDCISKKYWNELFSWFSIMLSIFSILPQMQTEHILNYSSIISIYKCPFSIYILLLSLHSLYFHFGFILVILCDCHFFNYFFIYFFYKLFEYIFNSVLDWVWFKLISVCCQGNISISPLVQVLLIILTVYFRCNVKICNAFLLFF